MGRWSVCFHLYGEGCATTCSTAQGATTFQECEPLRIPTAMGFRQNSLPFELEAGSGQRAEATGAFDIIGEMVATEERREYPEGV